MPAHTAAWVFHGVKDDVVPVSMSENMVEAVRAEGGDPRLTLLPDMDQGVGPSVWSRKDPHDWLLEHRMAVKPGEK